MSLLEERFEIGTPIHVGQVATAYPAVQKELDRKVLLKIFHHHWINDKELMERFNREGKALARIDNPNVVKVFDFGKVDGVPYLVLEWVEGSTLQDSIREGPLPDKTVKRIAADVLNGLRSVHEQGLLHRDIKPDNILVDNNGNARLTDFSLAGTVQLPNLTAHNSLVGSPAYMAPELFQGSPADLRSDLYSLGITLLEVLTGSNPFASDDPMISLELIQKVKPPRIAGGKIDPSLAALIDSLLARDPDKRPQSCVEASKILSGAIEPSESEHPHEKLHTSDSHWGASIISLAAVLISAILLISFWPAGKKSRISTPSMDNLKSDNKDNSTTREIPSPDSIKRLIEQVRQFDPEPQVLQLKPESEHDNGLKNLTSTIPGRLTIKVIPWAEVFIDEQKIGVSPVGTIELSPGSHRVNFRNASYPDISRDINIEASETDTLSLDLTEETGRINIAAVPWGYLWLDGDSIGMLPRGKPLYLLPGKHLLKIKHPELETWIDTIDATAGTETSIKIYLQSGTKIAEQ